MAFFYVSRDHLVQKKLDIVATLEQKDKYCLIKLLRGMNGRTLSCFSAPSMYLISALSNKFSTLVVPSLKALRSSTRFDRDLLPGSVI
jgi:hypothetical protein